MTNPFTDDDSLDRMTLSQIIDKAEHNFNHNEEDDNMDAPKKKVVTKKTEATAPAAAAKPAAKKTAPAKAPAKKETKPAAEKAPAAAKRGRAPGPRVIPAGFVGLEALAKEFKTDAGAIRRKLRNSDISKPEGGLWMFKDGSKDLAAVRKLLTPAA